MPIAICLSVLALTLVSITAKWLSQESDVVRRHRLSYLDDDACLRLVKPADMIGEARDVFGFRRGVPVCDLAHHEQLNELVIAFDDDVRCFHQFFRNGHRDELSTTLRWEQGLRSVMPRHSWSRADSDWPHSREHPISVANVSCYRMPHVGQYQPWSNPRAIAVPFHVSVSFERNGHPWP